MKPLPHQERFAHRMPDKVLAAHEFGTGKTVCACLWLKDNRDRDALIICPKRVVQKWQETMQAWGTKGTVVSKEQFKKMKPKQWSAMVVDEADEFASPLFISKLRSQLTDALYGLIKVFPTMPVFLATATPTRSSPWNLHTLLCYMGIYIDYKKWQDQFFSLEYRPYLPRPAWMPKLNWRKNIRVLTEKYADIVLLKDCVGYLPPVTEYTVSDIDVDPLVVDASWEPMAQFVAEHRNEQKNKVKHIVEQSKGFRKVLVVAHYTYQIDQLAKELKKDREVFVIHGSVKDQEGVIRKANESDECYFIVQASLGVGFDADTFSCVIFASMSYKARDYVQMKARARRIHNLHPVHYVYLIAGRCDKRIKEVVDLGRDFIPSEWNYATRTS